VVLMSDLHVSGPDMPPARLARIVGQVNALEPDAVLIAGDLVSDKRPATRHYSTADTVAPLARLHAPLGVFAVPGNHDHWRDIGEVTAELEKIGVAVLANKAVRAGPLALGGLDDDFTGHARPAQVLAAMDALGGGKVLLSHSPDPFADLPGGPLVMLAGHTHCGQIAYPWGGPVSPVSRYGERFNCGVVRERGNTLVVTGGLGTSVLPFRFFTRPDVGLIVLRPK
jgi:predicted MPP superfamily phosphohydrolase